MKAFVDICTPPWGSTGLGGRRLRVFFCLEWSAWMQRRSANTGLIVDAYHVLQETMGVLYNPEQREAMFVSGHTSRRVAS